MCRAEKLSPKVMSDRYRPYVGLLTSESINHDVEPNPRLIAPDPFASDAYLDAFSPDHQLQLTEIEDKNIMNSEDEPSSGLNARLRPRKSTVPSPQASKALRRPETKSSLDRPKRTSTPSKATHTKSDDLANKADLSTAPQLLCPFCDRKFASKQTVSKHVRRIHLSNPSNGCLFCSHADADPNKILRHMVDTHPTQYFACLDCNTRFSATSEIAEHKTNICEKPKEKPYRSKLRQKVSSSAKKSQKALVSAEHDLQLDGKDFSDGQCFNGVVISCELKPSQVRDEADIEDNITTNLILPPSKNLGNNAVIEKNAVIVLDDIQWNKRMPANFSFHNTDADQILSRLGVVHRSPRTGESTKKDWFKNAEDLVQKFEKCFDTSFYSKVASNVNENLTKFLDGSFNFNPDPDSIIKTRKSKYSVVINTAEGFPILLAFEQYSRNIFDGYIPRTLAPKHKWKWENDKNPLNPDDIKRDTHVNKCIITLVSSLDIWTQLCMRRKFEQKFSIPPLEKKTEKQKTISRELKEILESRELPKPSSQQVVKYVPKPTPVGERLDFPASLGLKPTAPAYDLQPAVLSGEWVRPRCYVCCACGAQTRDSRALSTHISSQHPNAQVQHYEIVGELLLNADILKHLYVPPSQMCNRTRPLRGFRECTKCKKSISLEDLHQHMLDCAGDTPAVRRKVRYRPFGVRRRRTRLPDNTIRKKIRKDIRSRQSRQKAHIRQRPKIRSEVGDAETIRKMLADLPAKRHRVVVNPLNPLSRPRRKLDIQRNKFIIKRRSSEIAQKRKQRELKNLDNSDPTVSKNKNNEDNDIKSNKSDDENKPLRPKIKRVITHGPRGTETLKRKVALKRAKKRAKLKEQEAAEENKEQPPGDATGSGSSSSGNQGDQSTDTPPRRIDVNEGPCSERNKSDRGRSDNGSNHDHQSPDSSGSENGDINNTFGPDPNTPLKHSIARLTSETELHESPLQYHHLFLTQQQECAEVDVPQHVPTGQPPLFENEAVVTKLDKPPLHFDTREPLDPYGLNRNKLPKPKKGLNDCIAMLKNKLSDPIPTEIVPHPVPCGNGDSLGGVTTDIDQRSPTLDGQTNMNSKPAEISYLHPDRFMDGYANRDNLIAQDLANVPFYYLPNPRAFDNSNAFGGNTGNPAPDYRVDLRYTRLPMQMQNEHINQKEPTRRRSTRGEKDSLKPADFVPMTSSLGYPLTAPPMVTPAKANPRPRRRSANQAVNHNAASEAWRPTGPYNQCNTPRIHPSPTYSTDAILAARNFEYHAQRLPEAFMSLNPTGAYAQAQNVFKHQQMVAEQFLAGTYLNKQKLAIDNNYADQKLTPPPIENMYVNSKQATLSPGSIYASSLQAVSPRSMYANNHLALQSPGNMYLHNTNISPSGTFANSMPMATSPQGMPAESMTTTTSPASIHANILNAENNRAMVIHDNINYHSQQISISPRSTGAKSQQTAPNPISTHANIDFSTSPESVYVNSKQALLNLENIYAQNKQSTVSPSGIDVNSKEVVIGLADTEKVAESPGPPHSKSNLIAVSSESLHDNSELAAINPKTINLAVSPGSTYSQSNLIAVSSKSKQSKQATICPTIENIAEIPGPTYPKSNINAVSFENVYIDSKQSAFSPYIENVAVSPGATYSKSNLTAVSSESLYVNSERAASSPSSKSDLAVVSPGSTYDSCKRDANTNNKQPSTSPGISYPDNSRQPVTNLKCIYINQESTNVSKQASGSNYISKKQAAAAADHHTKHGGTATETHYINKKQAASLENNHNKKHTAPSQESIQENNAYAVITAENNLLSIAKNACTESSYINKKAQAMIGKNNFPDKTIKLPTTESNLISRTPTTLFGEHIIKQTQVMIQSEKEFYNTTPGVKCKNSVTVGIPREPYISTQAAAAMESEIKETHDYTKHASENKNLSAISGSEFLSQREIACSKRNMIDKHLPNALVGRDKNMYKYHQDKEFHSSPTGIPSGYGAMNVIYSPEPDDIEPLDLTKSTADESAKPSKENDDTNKAEHYSSYKTLDLSRKGSQNVIVDLRVKMNPPEPDICSEPPTISNRNRVSSTDFSTKSRNVYNIPPNLSVRTKIQSDGYEFGLGRCTDCKDQEHIRGLLVKPRDCHIAVSPKATLLNMLSDPPGKVDEQEVLYSMSAKMSGELVDSHELLKNSINCESVQRDNLSVKSNYQDENNATYAMHKQPSSLLMLEPSLEEKTQSGDNNLSNDQQPVSGESSYEKTASYDEFASTAPCPMPIMTTGMSAAAERIKLLNNGSNQIPLSDTTVNLEKNAFSNASAIPSENAATISTIVIPPVLSKYETTKPVNTLVNACTSLTKIEPSNVAPTTDSILSIPSTTSACDAPEYTLTDTTSNALIDYGHIHSIPAQDNTSYVANTTCKPQVNDKHEAIAKQSKCCIPSTSIEATDFPKENISAATNIAFDSETAKKIAMLPKELVEILGTMPVDHRNQLLNVLPQYVSTSATTRSENLNASANNNTSVVSRGVSPARYLDFDVKPSLSLEVGVNKYETPDQIPKVYEIDRNTVIDLTEDDVTPRVDVIKVSEKINNSLIKTCSEPVSITPTTKPCKQKVNDQTASLRAVRIKAPSERNKSLSIDNTTSKKSSDELQLKANIEPPQEQNDSSDLDKTLAIQQAEISSTQHNTAIAGHCKYPLAISPSSTEYSGDESNKHVSQQSPVPVTQIVANTEAETKYQKPLPKSGKVSSSISTKIILKNIDKNLNNNVDICLPKDAVKDDEMSKKTEILSGKKSLETIPSENLIKPTPPKTAENDEDSDDDITLASIVKQKQGQVNVFKSLNYKPRTLKGTNKKKRKNRKGKKCDKTEKKCLATVKSSGDLKIDQPNDVILTHVENFSVDEGGDQEINSKIEIIAETFNQNEEITHFKKRPKKGQLVTDASDFVNKKEDKLQMVENIRYTQSEVTAERINIEVNLPTDLVPTAEENQKIQKKVATVDDDTEMSINKTKRLIDKDNVVRINECDEPLSTSIVTTIEGRRQIKENNKDSPVITDMEKRDKEKSISLAESTKKSDEVSTSIPQSSLYETETVARNDFEEDLSYHDSKKGKKLIRFKKKIYNKTYNNDLVPESLDNISRAVEAKDTVTPLRRSRRGKSQFLDSPILEPESALREITIEQKTPLTKKQRIFSKLLLDKECPDPSADSTPEKEDFITRELIKSTDTNTVDTTEISDIENIDDTLADKRKGTKRRIDGDLAKKTKKKKSFEDQNTNNEIIHAEDPPKSELSPENFDAISEVNEDVRDCTVTTAVKKDLATGLLPSTDVNSTDRNDIEKYVASTEKRKIINQVSLDLSQSSKPKKNKISKSDKKVEICPLDDIANKDEIVSTLDKSLPSLTPEAKTACYNLPLPSRRARSKSVVVQSTSYDPYDIDLEDMIEQSETFKVKENNSDYVNKNIKKNKLGNITNEDDVKILKEERKESLVKDESSENQLTSKKHKYDETIVSDSDDSSKSDIPLQKYVEEKEKRIAEIQAKMEKARELKTKENDQNKAKKETSPTTEKLSTEEELRSEQFMESFGFFSERKPRKSNLLATKKISETFHITNVSDDSYFGFKEKSNKKTLSTDTMKSTCPDMTKAQPQPSTSKKVAAKRGRRKKTTTIIMPCCELCKKEFLRSDNILRHQMTYQHLSKVCEIQMKIKPKLHKDLPPPGEPSYEMAFKQYVDRFNKLTDLLAVKKKNNPKAAAKIVVPTLRKILADVYKAIKAQQRVRKLSGDAALDCCELLRGPKKRSVLDTFEKALNKITTCDKKCYDGNVDSITAKNMLASEEGRNLENELISGLKEAATCIGKLKHQSSVNTSESSKTDKEELAEKMTEVAATKPTFNENQEAHKLQDIPEAHPEDFSDQFSSPNAADSQYEQIEEFDTPAKSRPVTEKKYYVTKKKMYPDLLIEDIDMFEDKFDKIKRKCRSQAAAAKQPQLVVEQAPSYKGRKKTEKNKGKRNSKKTRRPSAQVPTKGALKGFDGIKVSIPTSDINLSAIVPVPEICPKQKKKSSAKKKRDSESSGKNDSDEHAKDSLTIQKQVDVYEFMDNEDAELFELRPSTLMERFKSISNNKETPHTSKFHPPLEEASSQGSASDGDDFVYMSDDYVCSDDETENSLLSCELGNGKVGSDLKKISIQKRKDVVEKNAVMGKIFKHNAVRAEKKIVVPKDPEPIKANLDQLFDSLLEDEPNSSTLNSEAVSSHDECSSPPRKENQLKGKHSSNSHKSHIQTFSEDTFTDPSKSCSSAPSRSDDVACSSLSRRRNSSPVKDNETPPKQPEANSSKTYDLHDVDYYGPSTSTKYDSVLDPADYGPSTSKKYNNLLPKVSKKPSLKNYNPDFATGNDEHVFKSYETKPKKRNDSSSSKHVEEPFDSCDDEVKSPTGKPDEGISTSYDYSADVYDHSMLDDQTGVARQRARRKCTVGKQNVLAETWSSESEPDGGTHRPNSAESDVARKKKGKKREGQQAGGKRGNNRQVALKKQDIESRVGSGRVLTSMASGAGGSGSGSSVLVDDPGEGPSGLCGAVAAVEEGPAAAAAACAAMSAPAVAGPSGAGPAVKVRPRALTSYWSAEGHEEPEHVQQHGWIVGDSHKKLVTMLAHAKGRKRNNDDKRHSIE